MPFRRDTDFATSHLTGIAQLHYSMNAGAPSAINEPAYLPHILKNVAFHQSKPVELVARQSLLNSQTFFAL